ncbi:hypothetical protein [Halorussus amylolyticus]|uniref:hypothetical protein n=1 Tax=Halorussus amylolyticus TaxID=1126242 RepID=UPI001046EF34|nr:hypothetical protein [Halorussus amylolyticus]
MNRNRVIEVVVRMFVVALFALSVAGAFVAVQEGEGVISALFGVYLTGLLLVAVVRDSMQTRNWRLAFFAGVAVWGGYEYATTGSTFSLVLAGLGVLMVVANAFDGR